MPTAALACMRKLVGLALVSRLALCMNYGARLAIRKLVGLALVSRLALCMPTATSCWVTLHGTTHASKQTKVTCNALSHSTTHTHTAAACSSSHGLVFIRST